MNKCAEKTERDLDRQNEDKSTAICKTYSAYQKQKFLIFFISENFQYITWPLGHCNLNKTTYCSIWTEVQSGRSGNDIASALRKILNQVATDNSNISKIILWSDSFVPQNKNRMNSMMVLKFLEEHWKNRT